METKTGADGAIEASIEETNRIRAELGLKPLELKSDEAPAKRPAPEVERDVKKQKKNDHRNDNGEIGIGHDTELLEKQLKAGEELILTLKDSMIGDDDDDVLIESNIDQEERRIALEKEWDGKVKNVPKLYISRTNESRLNSATTGFKKTAVEGDVVGIVDEGINEYAGVANQLNTMTNLGTISTDDDYKRRQMNITKVAEMAKLIKSRREKNLTTIVKTEPKITKSSEIGIKRDEDGAIITNEFSTVHEFCSGVDLPQDRIAEMTKERSLRDRLAKIDQQSGFSITEITKKSTIDEDEESEEEKKANDDANLLADNELGDGVASVLGLLKSKGQLEPTTKKKKLAVGGRQGYVLPEVTIERKDEFGNKLTPKEAFNQLSYRFHGKSPGLNKQEKMLKKKIIEKQEQDGTAIQKLPTLRALKSAQTRGSSFLNLQNAKNKK